jgi:hypothetical protein
VDHFAGKLPGSPVRVSQREHSYLNLILVEQLPTFAGRKARQSQRKREKIQKLSIPLLVFGEIAAHQGTPVRTGTGERAKGGYRITACK